MIEVKASGASGRLQANNLSLWTPKGGPRVSLGVLNGNRTQLNMSMGVGTKTALELGCAGKASWLNLNTDGHGRANLMTSTDGTLLSLKPTGGEGGLQSRTRTKDGKTISDLHLSDIDGLPKVHIGVRNGKPYLRLLEKQGPALFSAP